MINWRWWERRSVAVALAALIVGCQSTKATSTDGGAGGTLGSAGRGGSGGVAGVGGSGGVAGVGGSSGVAGGPVNPGDSVLMHHKNPNRDGVYVQPELTKAAAAGLKLDTTFNANFTGAVFAQPLFVDGRGGTDLVIVATEADTVYAFDASSGRQVWMATLGTPVPLADMPCGNIDPLGITGTPVIDLASRTLFVAAMVTPDGGTTKQYKVFALSIDDGSLKPNWPVDMASTVLSGSMSFAATAQGQRGALAVAGGVLYVPFGGLAGDCGDYHGWVVAISIANSANVQGWATAGRGAGIWGMSGVASDGSRVYVTTGNTLGATDWAGGEALFSFPASLPLTTTPDYWAPTNWPMLDVYDADLGSSGPIVFDLAGSVPSHLVLALGKDAHVWVQDADHLGGIVDPVAHAQVANAGIISATALYTTETATYAAFRSTGTICTGGTTGGLVTIRIVSGAPPTIGYSWCAEPSGSGSPIVTTTDGMAEAIVWVVGAEGSNLLQGFDGDTGATIFAGGNAPIAGSRRFNSPIAAKGRIFVAADGAVVAFTP